MSAQATDLLLGALAVPAPAPPVGVPVPSFPGVVVTPTTPVLTIPKAPPPLTKPLLGCASLDPSAVPASLASLTVTTKPKPGTYSYRQAGTSTVDGVKKSSRELSASQVITQLPTQLPTELSRFRVDSTSFGGAKVSTTYSVLPSPLPQPVTIPGTPLGTPPETLDLPSGLYIVSMTTTLGNTTTTFNPAAPGLRIFDDPATPKKTWNTLAVDPSAATLVLLNGAYGERENANACGTAVNGWDITLNLQILGLSQNLLETQHLVFAAQLGGLIVKQSSEITGSISGHTITQKTESEINSLHVSPAPAAK